MPLKLIQGKQLNVNLTGSFTGSFSGSFNGTGSYAVQALSASYSLSSSYSNNSISASYAENAGTASNILGGKATHIPFFDTDTTLATSSLYQSGSGTVIINQDNATSANPEALYVWQPHPTSFNVVSGKGNLNNYLQLNIANTNQGINASSDIVATANNGDETTNYIDMGINSENYNSGFIGDANDAYLYSTGKHLHIGNASNEPVMFFAGGSDVDVYNKLLLNPNNQHNMTGSLEISGSLVVNQGITGSLFGTASYATQALSASYSNVSTLAATASYVENAQTASYVLQAVSSSYAATASYAPSYLPLTGGTILGDVTVTGTASIAFLNVQFESASVIYSSGSNIFGDATNDTQTLNGTVIVSGSQQITGSLNVLQGITGSLSGTASYATSASYALTSSYSTNITGSTNYLPKFTGANSLSNSLIYDNGTNVGIGTTTPAYKFDVSDIIRAQTKIIAGIFTPGAATGSSTIITTGRISAGGGITFYNPANGDNQDTGFKSLSTGVISAYSSNGVAVEIAGYGSSAAPLLKGIISYNPSTGTSVTKNFIEVTGPINTSGTYSGGIIRGLYYTPTLTSIVGVTSHRAIETVTGDVILGSTSGNVGIGTAAPSASLDVSGSGRFTNGLANTGSLVQSGSSTFNGGSYLFKANAAGDGGIQIDNSINGYTSLNWTSNAVGFGLMAGGGLFAKVSNNAGLHIGTTATSTGLGATLGVFGNATITSGLTVTGSLQVSQSIFQYSNNAAILSGTTANIASFATSSYMAGFFDFVASSGSNARAGTVFTVWNGTSLEYVETSTNDIGSTTNLVLSASLLGSNVRLQGTSLLGSWNVKTLTRMI